MKNAAKMAKLAFEEAIRKHTRPELLNRLTKIVHFNPLGMPIAAALPGGRVASGQAIEFVVINGSLSSADHAHSEFFRCCQRRLV